MILNNENNKEIALEELDNLAKVSNVSAAEEYAIIKKAMKEEQKNDPLFKIFFPAVRTLAVALFLTGVIYSIFN